MTSISGAARAVVLHRRLAWAGAVALAAVLGLSSQADAKRKTTQPLEIVDETEAWDAPTGPVFLIVSIPDQTLSLYSDGEKIAETPISTGTARHPTPTGVFSVIQKRRFHRSNLYSNAPMPYMQRITWSGVALHEGPLPGYPASHGCIRLPRAFAAKLWTFTKIGVRVVVTKGEVAPVEIAHPKLFKPTWPEALLEAGLGSDRLRPSLPTAVRVRTAEAEQTGVALTATDAPKPSAPAGERGGDGDADVTVVFDPTGEAIDPLGAETPFGVWPPPITLGLLPADAPLPGTRPLAVRRYDGPLAIFVSRKTQTLHVRQNFRPLFEAPIAVRDPDRPIGTHVFTAMQEVDDRAAMRWTVMTLPREIEGKPTRSSKGKSIEAPSVPTAEHAPPSPQLALDRLIIPGEIAARISAMLGPGSSLIVSDHGLGPETGKGTDFIVVTRE